MSELTASQTDAFAQLQAITNRDNEEDRAILESVGWDVQRAVQAIFDGDTAGGSSTAGADATTTPQLESQEPPRKMEQMEIDDSGYTSDSSPHESLIPRHSGGYTLFNIVTFPFSLSISLISNIVTFVFRILRIPLPRFTLNGFTFRPTGTAGPRRQRQQTRPLDPSAAAERWVRELEDETGAMCVSKASAVAREENGAEDSTPVPPVTGSSSAVKRPQHHTNGSVSSQEGGRGRLLPDFFIGSYESALRLAQNEAKMLCVVLVSDEHDDCMEFKRTVLTDPDLVRVLTDNQFIVWGGDVRDTEAYQTSLKLQSTTYPFVAFLSLHPRNAPRGLPSTSMPQLTVLSRFEGPPSTSTSAQALHNYMTATLIPRVTPLLTRVRNEKRAQEARRERERRAMEVERQLRAEQDRAFREAERADRDRIQRRIKEEKEKELAAQKEREAEEKQKAELKNRADWRRWAKANLVPPEPAPGTKGSLRIGVRLLDGKRVVRLFAPTDSLQALYTFVDCHFLKDDHHGDTPLQSPQGYEHHFGFNLATSFPRKEIILKEGVTLGDVEDLVRGGANLIVEMKAGFVEDSDGDDDSDASED